jgi:hypothetical protein
MRMFWEFVSHALSCIRPMICNSPIVGAYPTQKCR